MRTNRKIRPTRIDRSTTSRAAALVSTAVVGLVSWIGVHVIGNAELAVDGRTVGAVAVVGTSLGAGAAGWLLLALFERLFRADVALRRWRRVALVVGVLSLVGPLTADASWPDRWSLLAIHASVAVTAISAFGVQSHPMQRSWGDRVRTTTPPHLSHLR